MGGRVDSFGKRPQSQRDRFSASQSDLFRGEPTDYLPSAHPYSRDSGGEASRPAYPYQHPGYGYDMQAAAEPAFYPPLPSGVGSGYPPMRHSYPGGGLEESEAGMPSEYFDYDNAGGRATKSEFGKKRM